MVNNTMLKKDMIKIMQDREEWLWNCYCKDETLFGIRSELSKRSRHEWCVVSDLLNDLGLPFVRDGIEIYRDMEY